LFFLNPPPPPPSQKLKGSAALVPGSFNISTADGLTKQTRKVRCIWVGFNNNLP
jgi:hypothetical protein